jgi:RimJ/RimL family protein N-acetyltransferase
MMLEPGERTATAKEQETLLSAMLSAENCTVLVAEEAGRLVGYIGAYGGIYRRNSHTVCVVIGVLQTHSGRGFGSKLFEELEKWARQKRVHRLELTVMTHNAIGIALYKKMGFEIEGTRIHSMLVDGTFVDEYYMAKLLI